MSKYNNASQQSDYENQEPYEPSPSPAQYSIGPEPTSRRWWLFGLPILPFLLLWIIFPRTVIEEVPVTSVVTRDVIQEVTTVVTKEVPIEVQVEVTRIVTEIEQITVTQEVEVEVEVTREIVEVQEVEVTRVVTEYQPVEVTRVVEHFIPQQEPPAGGACARFNLEVGRDRERGTHGSGLYQMQELSSNVIATWQAVDGALDSGWVYSAPISDETVHVQVFFTPTGSDSAIQLEIVNPAPGTNNGWLARGNCHAVEIQFPA